MEQRKKSVIILGGGISGLTAAYFLGRFSRETGQSLHLQVVESSGHWGGAIRTETRDGFLLEHGPDSFATDKPALLELCRELGLGPELIGVSPEHRRIYLRRGRRLFPIPRDFHLMAPSGFRALAAAPFLGWAGKLRMAGEYFLPARFGDEDESLGNFMQRRFGREALEHLGQPLLGSIFGCDIRALSLLATFPRFREMEMKHGSIIRSLQSMKKKPAAPHRPDSLGMFVTLRSGMSRLIEVLRRETDAAWFPGAAARKIRFQTKWQVQLADGRVLTSDYLCAALPAFTAAGLFTEAFDLREALRAQPSKSMMILHAAFRDRDLAALPRASGWVGSADRKMKIQGGSFVSLKFEGRAPGGARLLRIFPGYQWNESLRSASDRDVIAALVKEFRDFFGIKAAPLWTELSRHEGTMPHYRVGHLNWLKEVEARRREWPGLVLAGNSYGGASLPDCVRTARAAAAEIMDSLKKDVPEVTCASAINKL